MLLCLQQVNESVLTCILNFCPYRSVMTLDSLWSFFILILVLVIQSDSFLLALNWLEMELIDYVSALYLRFENIFGNYYVWSWQNFQRDLMALTVVYICLKTLQAGLRMFMYDFFHNLCFCLFSPKIILFFALSYLDITWGWYIMFHLSGDTFWWICFSSCYWMVGEGNIDS